MSKDGRGIQLHKSNDVYHVRASALLELCPLEDEDSRNEVAPPGTVSEALDPWTRRLPYQPTDDERATHSTTHLPFRAWCTHCVKGLARGWPHRSDDGSPSDIPTVATDFCFVSTESDDDVRTILAVKEKQFQSVGATVKSASEFCGGPDHWLSGFLVSPGGHDHV